MNKKFSTLLASVLFASAFSTSAMAEATNPVAAGVLNDGSALAVKQGDYVYLGTSAGENYLPGAVLVNSNGKLAGETPTPGGDIKTVHGQMWQVASIKYDPSFGFPTYQFIDRLTGQYLAIKLITDTKNHVSSDVAKLDAGGNKDWRFDSNGNLYAYRSDVDSTYTLNSNLKLVATKGGADKINNGSTQKLFVQRYPTKVTLDAGRLNALMTSGKLYFNDADVSEGNDNILTSNSWKAYPEQENSTSKFFLMRADKDSVTSDNRNPNLLMVDTMKYAGGDYHKFVIDTLAISKEDAAKMKDKDALYKAGDYAPTIATFARQIATATWSANYTLYNDSISLTAAAIPTKPTVNDTYYDATLNQVFKKANGEGTFALTDVPGYNATNMEVTSSGAEDDNALEIISVAVLAYLDGASATSTLSGTKFTTAGAVDASGDKTWDALLADGDTWVNAESSPATDKDKAFLAWAKGLNLAFSKAVDNGTVYYLPGYSHVGATASANTVALKQLADTKILTVAEESEITAKKFIVPLIQPYATTGGDAVIDGNGKVYFIQVAAATETVPTLRAGLAKDKYLVVNPEEADNTKNLVQVDEVDASNVYAQWAFIQGATGSYQVVNRGTGKILYSGPVNKGDKADTYKLGDNTYKLAGIDLSDAVIYDEKGTKYDYTGAFYAGPADGVSQSFAIAPASQFLTTLGLQFNKDSVLVLGEATNAPQWYLEAGTPETYGYSVPGLPELKKVTYKIYTKDGEGVKYYVYPTENAPVVFAITKEDSKNAKDNTAKFEFRTIAKDTYLFFVPAGDKMATINLNMTQPVIEVSGYSAERQDYFTITKSEYSNYRTLTAEDGVLGNATIYMENEPNRFLYENTQNIVANNGNKIAKDSLNFLGIFNAAAMVKNAAIYVDTAYIDRKDNTRPQYMFAVGVTEVAATEGHACTESGKHFDADGKETTADKCVHATPGTEGYKTGRYLVSLKDSVPTGFAAKHPTLYDGNIRLAFVEAKHIKDTLEIANSKFTADEHVKDSIFVGSDLQKVTFALKIVDQATKSFVLETKDAYVRILNGVPVLTGDIKEAAVLNISATEAEATANDAISAEAGVQVIGGQGAVTVQGAVGKVITVANILGQTIANQVAASDNVTIAAPAGVVVVAVDGDATKVVVK